MSSNYGGKSGSSTGGGTSSGGSSSGGGKFGKSGKGGPIIPLYGVVIQECIRRGDTAEMRSLLDEARRQHGELGDAIRDLEKAASGSGGKY